MPEVERVLAKHIVKTSYKDLPLAIIATVKERIMDTVGCIIAGSAAPACDLIAQELISWEGKPESTVIILGNKLPSAHAAQIHSSWAHAYDFDDNDDRNACKGSVSVVPVSLALAERVQASGKDLILAVALGLDLGCRFGLALRPTTLPTGRDDGYFGATAAGAKLLGLDEESILNAWDIGYTQLAAAPIDIVAPSLTKRLIAGQVARAAVWAVLMAKRGFPAGRGFFHGEKGYYCYFRKQEGDLDKLTVELGTRFEVKHCPKPYPSCRFTHAPIDATLSLVKENRFSENDVESITVSLSQRAMGSVGGLPDEKLLAQKRKPVAVVDAQFSAPYTIAVTIRKKCAPDLKDFTAEALRNPDTLALAARVTPAFSSEFDQWPEYISPALVEIRLKDGKVLRKQVSRPKGHYSNPASPAELRAKFMSCLENAGKPFPARTVEQALKFMDKLEEAKDITPLFSLLTAKAR
ncbi:MAG: MmgE/PrpD family protein [Dehalococcoidales bacterium]|nr:MmgE/PrpD family protein [Dehalococcoidales bacterium]